MVLMAASLPPPPQKKTPQPNNTHLGVSSLLWDIGGVSSPQPHCGTKRTCSITTTWGGAPSVLGGGGG